ncbi:Transposon TX1 uncharacterized 149 kDa protein [Vitis vinifera]|uniref:Transposon TX1 uncharacterized 149 kDa protein n=1 Tax=Vitis vinifera TaxID=29760 RepID=A0A438GPZ5_VITVI|nr:Transposon TX1 uncharacterized 149 kDa protein [Vitis vinifera]
MNQKSQVQTSLLFKWCEVERPEHLGFTEEGRKQSRWKPSTREVEGDEASRAATRVEQLVGVETEAQSQSDDGTDCLSQDMSPSVKRAQTRVGSPQGLALKSGPTASGLLRAYGPKSPPASEAPKGDQSGPRLPNRLGRGAGYADDLEKEFTRCREEEMGRRQQLDPINPSAERMLEEEAARYVSEINMVVPGFKGLSLLIFFVSVGLRRGSITTILGEKRGNSGWKWVAKTKYRRSFRKKGWLLDMVEISSDDPTGSKRKVIKSVIRSQKVDLFCIQETKMQVMSEEVVRSLGPGRYLDWKALNAMGQQGGVSMEEFGAIRGLWEDPWCLGGDFNSTLYQAERSRNGRITSAMRRLDRFLVSPNWIDQYSRATQRRLPRPISDHFPILLEGGGLRRGPYPFKFENMWLKAEGFKELIEGWWQGIVVRGRPSYRLAAKMRGLKHNLKIWNKEVFGRLEKNKAEALQQVERWDVVEEERALSEEEEGDRNTGFFHRMANAHRRFNNLIKIKINGVRLTEDQDVRDGIVNAYQHLLSENSDWKADIGGLVLKQISLSEADALELPFTEAEIYAALMGMNGDKAPGPDGFTVAFWQNCWEIVKEDVLDMFKEFYDQNSFIKSLNHTFLVLIPKKGGAEDLGDYGPISLLGGLYKLLAKVLANRLKKIIDKVISPDQNAFIKGRQILDGSLIANEVLHKMGFGSKWIGWMWSCISTIKYSMLVNGVPAGFFSSSKGLRQGDPLSPYLFIMGMEVLSALISRAVEGGFIYGCRIWKGRGQPVNITHLLFADDTIVFCEAKKESLLEVEGALDMAAEIGCKVGQLPTVYLGLPLGAPNRASSVWDGVEEKMRRKLALWKRHFLSKGGRITLIKSTLASIPLFARAKEELWKKVLEAKYGKEEFGWRTKKANGVFGVGVWKEILKESTWCWDNMVFKVRKGNKVRFWIDPWCGNNVLSEAFPDLFSMAVQRNATVEDYWDQNLSQGGWSLRLLRDFNDWELGLVDNMLVELRNYRVSMEEDSVFWRGGADGLF